MSARRPGVGIAELVGGDRAVAVVNLERPGRRAVGGQVDDEAVLVGVGEGQRAPVEADVGDARRPDEVAPDELDAAGRGRDADGRPGDDAAGRAGGGGRQRAARARGRGWDGRARAGRRRAGGDGGGGGGGGSEANGPGGGGGGVGAGGGGGGGGGPGGGGGGGAGGRRPARAA